MSRTRSSKASAAPTTTMVDPIVKWVGGKRRIAEHLIAAMPLAIRTYYEPFCGGAAVLLALQVDATRVVGRSIISDACGPLITTYRAIIRDADAVSAELRGHEEAHRAVHYDTVREEYNRDRSVGPAADTRLAGRFLYLNRACFNGLYRTNRAGEFNVPFGKARTVTLPSLAQLHAFATALRYVGIEEADYGAVVARASRGDVVYADPPYDSPTDDGFTAYGAGQDRPWEFQVQLAGACALARDRGATVIASNRATNRIRDLWGRHGFEIRELDVRHMVGATAERRGLVGEIIAVGRPR